MEDCLKLSLSPDKSRQLYRQVVSPCQRIARPILPALHNVLVQTNRLYFWRHAKLSVEDADTRFVLSHSRCSLPGAGIRTHQAALGWFVQRIE